jgi:hypothetical protein
LAGVLERHGITQYQVYTDGKHPYILFKVEEHKQAVRFPFAATSSNWNAMQVSRANLVKKLREMGVEPRDPVDKTQTAQPTEPVHVEVPPPSADAEQIPPTGKPEQEPATEPEVEVEQQIDTESVWDDETVVHFAKKQLLWVPLPPNPVLVLELDMEIVAERGDKLVLDLNSETVRLLSSRQVAACFRPYASNTTNLRDAVKIAMRAPQQKPESVEEVVSDTKVVSENEADTKAETKAERIRLSKGRFQGVGLQMGRVLVAMDFLQRTRHTDKIDTASLASVMSPSDKLSIASQVSFAANKKFVYVVGPIPGRRGNYYRLTEAGRKKARELGNEPFARAGMRPPVAVAAE